MRVPTESHEEADKLKKCGPAYYIQCKLNEDSERRRSRLEKVRKRREKWAQKRPPEQTRKGSRKHKECSNQGKKQETSASDNKKTMETEKERHSRKERMREYNAERQVNETRERNKKPYYHKRKLSEEEVNHIANESHESDSSVEVIEMESSTELPASSKTTSCDKMYSNVQLIDISSDTDTNVKDSDERPTRCTKEIDKAEICELLETDDELEEIPLVQESSVQMKEPDIDKLSMKPVVVLKRLPLEDWIAKLTVPDVPMEQSDTEESLSVESSQSDVDIDVENQSTDMIYTFERSMESSSAEVEQIDAQHTESSDTDESVSTECSTQSSLVQEFRLRPSVVLLRRIDLAKILDEITSRC
jgi:hypothetical protein